MTFRLARNREESFMRKTWLITGSSRGFGWELAQAVLDSGDAVLATALHALSGDRLAWLIARSSSLGIPARLKRCGKLLFGSIPSRAR